eukprot:8836574-Ditylum_brightwellii.AAC.1
MDNPEMKETVGVFRGAYDKMYDALNDQKEMGMMLHMQKQTLESSLKDSSSCKSVNNLHKSLTNLQSLDDTVHHIVPESLKLSQPGN